MTELREMIESETSVPVADQQLVVGRTELRPENDRGRTVQDLDLDGREVMVRHEKRAVRAKPT